MGNLFSFLDKLIDKLPIQGRVERWKNQLNQLKKEQKLLLKSKCDSKKSKRYEEVTDRIEELNELLKNKAE